MQGLALVDYDNLCPGNRSELEVETSTATLLESLARASQTAFPGLGELDVRLYGGWLDEQGVPSPSARWLLPLLPALRGRRQGLIVRPTLATTMLQFPDVALHGTFVADTLRSCGAPLTGDPDPTGPTVPEAELRVMERLMRAYRRTNLVCLQDDKLSALFSDYHWPPVRKRLVEHGIVKVEDRATSGRPKQFLRSRFLPGQIMAGRVGRPGTDPRIRAFWEALAASAA